VWQIRESETTMNTAWQARVLELIVAGVVLGAIASTGRGEAQRAWQAGPADQSAPGGPVGQPGRGPLVPPPLPQPPAPERQPSPAAGENLPIDRQALSQLKEPAFAPVRNLISLGDIRAAIGDGPKGLTVALGKVTTLLDGTSIDPQNIYGTAYAGPDPFEAAETRFAYKRFRLTSPLVAGTTLIEVGRLLEPVYNSERWNDGGTLAVRLELHLAQPGPDRSLGVYDTPVAFRRTQSGYQRLPTVVEGPFVGALSSDHPTQAAIHFVTDTLTDALVLLDDGRKFRSIAADNHLVLLTGLMPQREYRYEVRVGPSNYGPYRFRTASPAGATAVTFAFCGDSRGGIGGDAQNRMGVNCSILERLAAIAHDQKADFLLMGGDLFDGCTSSPADFQTQMDAWKQAVAGFWHERPVYAVMGNHDCLSRVYEDAAGGLVWLDGWPYATASSEAAFAAAFLNPDNGPRPSDSRRPPYRENAYSFQFGPLRVIGLNNTYWQSSRPEQLGGSPEGYIMEDQVKWIEEQIARAETDPNTRYVILFAHEPMFPCAAHVGDAMWYGGNNNVRAYTFTGGKLQPEPAGILEVRNRLAEIVAASGKIAAVLP